MGVQGIQKIVFDVYGTLFDVHSIKEKCEELFPGNGRQISELWRAKQLEYAFIKQIAGRYRPFDEITRDSLQYTCRVFGVKLSEQNERNLEQAYHRLSPYQEVEETLERLAGNYKLAVLSNGSPNMLYPLLEHHRFNRFLEQVISVDDIKQFKPSPQAYTYGLERLNCRREEILFLSSNTWDITGASAFGFHTVWVNRKNVVFDYMGQQPTAVISNLRELSGILQDN